MAAFKVPKFRMLLQFQHLQRIAVSDGPGAMCLEIALRILKLKRRTCSKLESRNWEVFERK